MTPTTVKEGELNSWATHLYYYYPTLANQVKINEKKSQHFISEFGNYSDIFRFSYYQT